MVVGLDIGSQGVVYDCCVLNVWNARCDSESVERSF